MPTVRAGRSDIEAVSEAFRSACCVCIPRFLHVAFLLVLAAAAARAQPNLEEQQQADSHQLRFQSTAIWQGYPGFRARQSGDSSLPSTGQGRETVTATAFLGARLLPGTEIWLNPELAQGFGLNRSFGIAGFPNGDASKAGNRWPREYVARAFLRQTIDLDGERVFVPTETNQLSGSYSSRRLVITAGKLAVGDVFGDNRYSRDARTQFMNWSLLEAGAWDFASDARQYTWGGAVELILGDYALRYGSFTMPTRYNPPETTWHGFGSLHHVVELAREHVIAGLPGAVRLLGFYSRAHGARFREVLASPLPAEEAMPALRRFGTPKIGFVLNTEQALTPQLGAFLRASWDDGRSEDISFTQIDRSLSAGLSLAGTSWQRPNDTLGLAGAVNAISHGHRSVLRAGGTGLIVGSMQSYSEEYIGEIYYNAAPPMRGVSLAANFQIIGHPGYDSARGPVFVFGGRLHFAIG